MKNDVMNECCKRVYLSLYKDWLNFLIREKDELTISNLIEILNSAIYLIEKVDKENNNEK